MAISYSCRVDSKQYTGWDTSQSTAIMVLKNARGASRRLDLDFKHMEVAKKDGNKFLIVFNHPLDIRGTALLSHTHINGPNDTWLYLPDLRRVKRIVSRDKSRPFMGSEFTYLATQIDLLVTQKQPQLC